MHYYKKNIGDYHKKAGRLSILQHGVYNLLMDSCYDREDFPTLDEAIDWVWASSEAEVEAVKFVLKKLFKESGGVYTQSVIQDDLKAYKASGVTNKRIAIERERKREEAKRDADSTKREADSTKRASVVNDSADSPNEATPNHKPLTNNQEPLTINQELYVQEKDLPAIAEEYVLKLPTNKTDVFYLVTNEEINNYKSTYQAVDIEQQYREILSWLNTNSKNRKTIGGMPKFINAWLSKAQNKAPRVNTPHQRPVSTTEFF